MEQPSRRVGNRLDRRTLAEVATLASDCRLCRLCDGRTHVVFGSGREDADLMFVTEAPGYHEDRLAQPFVGAAADLFAELLRGIGFERDDVYVTSVVKCRPPRNRTPFPDEIEQCEGYLFHEVTAVQPKVVCALGNVAIRLLTGRPHRLSVVHGQPSAVAVQGRDVIVHPMYHPAAAVQVPALVSTLRQDFAALPRLLRSGIPAEPFAPTAVAGDDAAADAAGTPAAAGLSEAARVPVSVPVPVREQLAFDIGSS